MNLESKVIFKCDIHNVFTFSHEFKNLDELRTIIQGQCVSEIPYSIDIIRRVIVFDRDKKTNGIIYSPNGVNVADEKLNLVMANKLIYPKDVRKILKKEYNSTFDLSEYKLDEKVPVKSFNVSEKDVKGAAGYSWQTLYTLHNVSCEQLQPNDIVIDRNLNQIWLKKTGKVPTALTEMLSHTKEIIH